jgi:phosphoribosyl-ATP pyrophosphohydrolase
MDQSRLDREEAESLLLQLDEEQKLLTKVCDLQYVLIVLMTITGFDFSTR